MVAPVVVKPEIDSKKASPKLLIEPLIINGRVPKMLKISQMPVIIMYPSLFPKIFSSLRRGVKDNTPVTIAIKAE
jgi:hypothetical protein